MPFANIDTSFLKEEVGPTLATGLAETVIAAPADPVEYLALWLLHHLQMKELAQQERATQAVEEQVREEWTKSRQKKQTIAAHTIQQEWKHHIQVEDERKHAERKLLEIVQDKERELEDMDEYREENIQIDEPEGMSDLEREKALDTARTFLQYSKAQGMIGALDKGSIAVIKAMKNPSRNIFCVMRCCFYIQGLQPKAVKTWQQVRMLIKPALFLEKSMSYDPKAPAPKKKRTLVRIRRVLRCVKEEDVRAESVAVFLLYQWLLQIVELRARTEDENKVKREAGRDVEEEEEEEEEQPDETNLDPDEEEQRLVEEEEKRLQEEEEARWKAENGEEEGEEGDGEDE